jgi:transketolase
MKDAELEHLHQVAQQLRADAIRCTSRAGSGHPTSGMSAADLVTVLLARHLRRDWSDPGQPGNDHLIFSKGHASSLFYAALKAVGAISDEELLTYRTFGSRLQGHPTPDLPWVKVATGSLGQGLPVAVGIALAGALLDRLRYRVWVLCGDGELAEGSMWEALDKAAYYRLANLTAIVDLNRLGQRGPTAHGWDEDLYRRRVEAFGCGVTLLDGHDLTAIDEAMAAASAETERPTVLIARTVKGKGFSALADQEGWHGRALPPGLAERAIAELGGGGRLRLDAPHPVQRIPARRPDPTPVTLPVYQRGEPVPIRQAFGEALRALGARADVVVLDGDVSSSTFTDLFQEKHPDRMLQMFIAEQQMVATAVGLSVCGYVPFLATFAAFLTRAHDFLRMAAVSRSSLRVVGTHGGVEIGRDGPSQMGLEDLAMMRSVHGSTVLYPSDAACAAKLVERMAETPGISYLRVTRGGYTVLYGPEEEFPVGGSKVLRQRGDDEVTLVGAGVTLHHCLAAADGLATAGAHARVIDAYSVKPIDRDTLVAAARTTQGRVVVAEDHYPEGGLGCAVIEALAGTGLALRVAHLAVRSMPTSGRPEELLRAAGISAEHIVAAAHRLIGGGEG